MLKQIGRIQSEFKDHLDTIWRLKEELRIANLLADGKDQHYTTYTAPETTLDTAEWDDWNIEISGSTTTGAMGHYETRTNSGVIKYDELLDPDILDKLNAQIEESKTRKKKSEARSKAAQKAARTRRERTELARLKAKYEGETK